MQNLDAITVVSTAMLVVCQQVDADCRNEGWYKGRRAGGGGRRKSRESCGQRLVGIPEASPQRLLVQGGPRWGISIRTEPLCVCRPECLPSSQSEKHSDHTQQTLPFLHLNILQFDRFFYRVKLGLRWRQQQVLQVEDVELAHKICNLLIW